jgi:ferredoxin
MNDEELPVVDVERCTACGDCVEACPLDLFTLEPISHHAIVQCSSPLSGDLARSICKVACDACGRCAQDAPEEVITMAEGLPVVHAGERAPESCTFRCPTGAIQWVEGNQFQQRLLTIKGVSHG